MKALITGGAGFIGSHLADALLARGDEVYALDDLSTGREANISHLKDHPRFHFIVEDMMREAVTNELVNKVDHIYHLAAVVGVKLVVQSPVRTLETNLKTSELIYALANKFGKKVLLASTSEVYGRHHTNKPLAETDERIYGPTTIGRWSYAESKAIDEFLALAYHQERNLDVVIVRFFNTVGPRQTGQYGMVIPSFVQAALEGRAITIYGDGSQSRSFTYVGDAVRAITGLMSHPEAVGQIYNVGNGQEITIRDLAYRIKERTGSSSDIKFISYEEAYGRSFEDMEFRTPDIAKIRGAIGYEPTVDLDEILDRVIAHYRGEASHGSDTPSARNGNAATHTPTVEAVR